MEQRHTFHSLVHVVVAYKNVLKSAYVAEIQIEMATTCLIEHCLAVLVCFTTIKLLKVLSFLFSKILDTVWILKHVKFINDIELYFPKVRQIVRFTFAALLLILLFSQFFLVDLMCY